MSARLSLSLTNSPDEKKPMSPLWFQQEEGKKSSFALDLNGVLAIEKPAHTVIRCFEESSKSVPFLFGGLELVSNSRNVEVYTSDEEGKESYMKTCRGIVFNDGSDEESQKEEWFKCVIVCNGGPRSVSRVNLKLLSLRPAKCTRATLKLVKLKGRLPDVPLTTPAFTNKQPAAAESKSANASPAPNSTGPQLPQQQPQQPALTQEDIGSAMAAMSMLVRVTEDRLAQKMNTGLQRVETAVGQGFAGFQQSLTELCSVVVSQRNALQQQSQLLTQQQEMIQSQNLVLKEMQQNQMELIHATESLREELELVRQEMREHRPNGKDVEEANGGKTGEAASSPTRSVGQDIPSKSASQGVIDSIDTDSQGDKLKANGTPDSNNGKSTPTQQAGRINSSESSASCDGELPIDTETRAEEEDDQGEDAMKTSSTEDDGGKKPETIKGESTENEELDYDNSETMEQGEAQAIPREGECSSKPAEEDGVLTETGSSAEQEAQQPLADGPHVIEDDSPDSNEGDSRELSPESPGSEEKRVEQEAETQVTAMNPVPEQHWSLADADLLGLGDVNETNAS